MMLFCSKIFLLFLSFTFLGYNISDQKDLIKSIIKSIQQKYAPDKRTAIFNISYRQTKSGIVLRGKVDNADAKKSLIDTLSLSFKNNIIDQIRILPDTNLCKYPYGIILTEVCDMRRKPNDSAELVNQALMGSIVKIIDKERKFLLVQTPCKYLGWIDSSVVIQMSQDGLNHWNKTQKIIVTALQGKITKEPLINSTLITNVSIGCIVKCDSILNKWTLVELSDGTTGYIQSDGIENYEKWVKNRSLTVKNIEKTAKLFLGTPYLWGGTSARGLDCSGFVKMVFRLNGLELNRDANQQALQGAHIEPGNNFDRLKKGDLLFFGKKATTKRQERITHVAIYLGNKTFIHSSEQVKLGSFNPSSKYFDKSLLKKFVRARRLI